MDRQPTMTVYECSGLALASAIPLSAPKLETVDVSDADVVVLLGDRADPPFERPSADLIAELVVENYLCYTICRVADGFVIRVPWTGDFVIDPELRRVTCHPAVNGRPEILHLIVTGTVTAFLLAMRGQCVLHGSAVEFDGRSVAFVGVSGQGKSTMAATFCHAGARLVTDDLLPLRFGDSPSGGIYTVRSGREIRLRDKAETLARRFDPDAVRRTDDERYGVTPELTPFDEVPLLEIVLPRPDREKLEVEARRLSAGEATLALGRCQRIEGWQDRHQLRAQFAHLSRVVDAVPVFEVSVPWGPPFAHDLAPRVLEACGLGGASTGLSPTGVATTPSPARP